MALWDTTFMKSVLTILLTSMPLLLIHAYMQRKCIGTWRYEFKRKWYSKIKAISLLYLFICFTEWRLAVLLSVHLHLFFSLCFLKIIQLTQLVLPGNSNDLLWFQTLFFCFYVTNVLRKAEILQVLERKKCHFWWEIHTPKF